MALVPHNCRVNKICGWEEFKLLFFALINYAISIALLVVGIAVIWGGFLIMTSGGDQGRVTQGRQAITRAVIGAAIVFGSYLIVNTILEIFTDCSGWQIFGGITC